MNYLSLKVKIPTIHNPSDFWREDFIDDKSNMTMNVKLNNSANL
jgi:hypothetical protein